MPDLWELQAESKCPFPIAMLTDRSIGDMVLAFAALQILAGRYEQVVLFTNIPELIPPMAPPNANHHLGWLPYHSQAEMFNISVGSSMNPRYGHPIKQILDHIGVEAPAQIPQPKFRFKTQWTRFGYASAEDERRGIQKWITKPIVYPAYDFLLHMNSDDEDRKWHPMHVAALCRALMEEYPGCSIGILGSDQRPPWNHHRPDPRILDEFMPVREAETNGNQPQPGVEYLYNRGFQLIGALIAHCRKAVITIDSSVSRIAHAVGSKNHVLLCPEAYCVEWSSHPGCYNVFGNPKTWSVFGIMNAVRAAAEQGGYRMWAGYYTMPPRRDVDAAALWQLRKLFGIWSKWPRTGNIELRLTGGFGVLGSEVDLTRLSHEQANQLVDLAQRANIFDSISTAVHAAS